MGTTGMTDGDAGWERGSSVRKRELARVRISGEGNGER